MSGSILSRHGDRKRYLTEVATLSAGLLCSARSLQCIYALLIDPNIEARPRDLDENESIEAIQRIKLLLESLDEFGSMLQPVDDAKDTFHQYQLDALRSTAYVSIRP